ncbi:hypothetical protein BZL54_21915 [Burkholderia ubonensis subsp. mesacidophila]|uniref:Uncharacterized protein n=1 Tax=Burkholderia ubonensis subsp. mesacidophila TaxID=265293 RepID=A0A2A4FAE2_9BURK|nr:hypothetical protein BZL54_21915 [Burkholderia ubonensis subsp. mesacidophila]
MHARQTWHVLAFVCLATFTGLITLAPQWRAGAMKGELNALALFALGIAAVFLSLARTEPGRTMSTRCLRYLFALVSGTAANVVLTWGLWAIGFPITNDTVRSGLMERHYWLGPAILAYSVVVWLFYRASLRRDGHGDQQ